MPWWHLPALRAPAWGLVHLVGASSPDNSTNELRELGIAFGTGVVVGGVPAMCGLAMLNVANRRRRRGTVDAHRP